MTEDKITFISNRQPGLGDGKYELHLNLDISSSSGKIDRTYERTFTFTVSGERFAVKPAEIESVFPPSGSLGDHSDALPHIILHRSSLPWERKADPERDDAPWLAVLLFDEQEDPQPEVMSLEEVRTKGIYPSAPGQDGKDMVTVIHASVDRLPTTAELTCLAHVRSRAGSEMAVVIGNQLPVKGRMCTAHLVSVEGCYKNGSFNGGQSGTVQLISLYNWRFTCLDGQQSFKNLLTNLKTQMLRMPKIENKAAENFRVFAEKYLAMGCVPLPHVLRKGGTTISWYHGPLVPGENTTPSGRTPSLPILSADQLVRYNEEYGLFDVSYAAAWELGRLLALQNKTFSTSLYTWKRSHARQLQEAERALTHLPFDPPAESLDLPPVVRNWFERLEKLEIIPFNYLVPDERMLPKETICFFSVDWLWLECMWDGAFSIGRVTQAEHQLDSRLESEHMSRPSGRISGFLLRSEVVGGWPGLLVDGFQDDTPLALLRMEALSKNILICLFDGEVNKVDFYLKPESMHFGVDVKVKSLKDEAGNAINIGWRGAEGRVMSILPKSGIFTSAQFASQMIEGVDKVRFTSRLSPSGHAKNQP